MVLGCGSSTLKAPLRKRPHGRHGRLPARAKLLEGETKGEDGRRAPGLDFHLLEVDHADRTPRHRLRGARVSQPASPRPITHHRLTSQCLLGGAVLSAVLLARTNALAAPHRATLSVLRGEGALDCADARELAAATAEIAGPNAISAEPSADSPLAFVVSIARSDGTYRATVRSVRARPGTREIADASTDCKGLGSALATTLAMLVDDLPRQPPAAVASPPRGTPWTGALAVGAGVVPSLLRGPSTRLFAETVVQTGSFLSFGLGAFGLPEVSAPLAPGEVSIAFMAGSGKACVRWVEISWSAVRTCIEPAFGALLVSGHGFPKNTTSARPWGTAEARFELDGRIGWGWGLGLRAGLLVPLGSKTVVVDGIGTAWRSTGASFAGGFALTRTIW